MYGPLEPSDTIYWIGESIKNKQNKRLFWKSTIFDAEYKSISTNHTNQKDPKYEVKIKVTKQKSSISS